MPELKLNFLSFKTLGKPVGEGLVESKVMHNRFGDRLGALS
jgi:hypothetical protein